MHAELTAVIASTPSDADAAADAIRIRPAVPDDAAAVLRHLRTVGGETPYLPFGAEGPGRDEAAQRALLAGIVGAENGLALVATRGDEVVACLTFLGGARARTRHAGEFGISVDRACWGRGVGRRMLAMLLDWAARGGVVRKVNLRVQEDNARAIALYESLGFTHEGRLTRDSLVDGAFFDVLLMGRAVEPDAA